MFSDVKNVKSRDQVDYSNTEDIDRPADITLDDQSSSSSDDDILTTPPETASAPPHDQWHSGSGEYASVPGEGDLVQKRKYPVLPSSDWPESAPGPQLPPRITSRDPGSRRQDNDPDSQTKLRDLETARARAEIHRHREAVTDIDMDIILNEQISENLQNEAANRLDERDVLASKQELLNARKEHREKIRHLSGEIDRQEFGPKPEEPIAINSGQDIVSLVTKTLAAMQLLSEEIKEGKQRMSGLEDIIASAQNIQTPALSVPVSRDTRESRAVGSKQRSHKTREQSADQGAGAARSRGHRRQRGGGSPSSSSSSSSSSSGTDDSSSSSDSDSQDDNDHQTHRDRDTPHPRGRRRRRR